MTTHKWRPLIFNQLILIDIDNKINEIRNHSTKYEKKTLPTEKNCNAERENKTKNSKWRYKIILRRSNPTCIIIFNLERFYSLKTHNLNRYLVHVQTLNDPY